MTRATHDSTTLVLGATGKTGRRVAQRLGTRGMPVRIGSRSADPRFDWGDPRGWAAALRGVDQVYITYQPDLAFPGATERVHSFSRAAVANGVRRVVLLSGRNDAGAEHTEDAVRAAGAAWTVVRSSFFNQNFSEAFFVEPLLHGELAFPAGDVTEPFVDADDIADVVVAALTEEGHAGRIYEVTGPRLLTFGEAVAEIATAAGRDLSYRPITPDQFGAGLRAAGLPAEEADAYTELFAGVLDGRNAYVGDGVENVLHRPPRDFAAWVRDVAATGIWAAPEGRVA